MLKKHPIENKFVYSVFKSSNIDFIEVSGNKIKIIKSLRLKNPLFTIDDLGNDAYSISYKESECVLGYLDIYAGNQFVYALHTDDKIRNEKGEYNPAASDQILVFDWKGNPILKYILDEKVYYISINRDGKELYAIGRTIEGEAKILKYNLEF
jgi:hypothetical protein